LLRGIVRERDPLGALESFAKSRATAFRPRSERVRDDLGRPCLALAIHPAAEPLRIAELGGGTIEAEAGTGTAGPGYHAHLSELLTEAGRALGIEWTEIRDESGYFESGRRAALEDATLIALAGTAMEALAMLRRGWGGIQLSLPQGVTYEHDGAVATPLGPRDHDWLKEVAREPRRGIDVFPWWEPGEGAATLRGAALAAMWIDVRWRPPVTAEERALLEQIVDWLEQGFALAPEEAWPWREWAEVLEHLGEDSLRATRVKLRAAGLPPDLPIGYRRRPVRVWLSGGWSIQVPGEFAERWEEPGVWVGWDATRSVWFSSVEVEGSKSTQATLDALPPLEGEGELLAMDGGGLRALARAGTFEEEGRTLGRVLAHAATGPHAAIGTLVYENPDDRAWALATWSSLAFHGPAPD
jgi:hypothetical protein